MTDEQIQRWLEIRYAAILIITMVAGWILVLTSKRRKK